MELKNVIDCQCRVSATYEEDGTLRVKVFASADYAKNRSATAEVADVPEDLQASLAAAMKAVLDAASPKLGQRVSAAMHKSAEVAAAHGEI